MLPLYYSSQPLCPDALPLASAGVGGLLLLLWIMVNNNNNNYHNMFITTFFYQIVQLSMAGLEDFSLWIRQQVAAWERVFVSIFGS